MNILPTTPNNIPFSFINPPHVRTSSEWCEQPNDNFRDAVAYFPQTIQAIGEIKKSILEKAAQIIKEVLEIPAEHRTFKNSFFPIDYCHAQLHSKIQTLRVVALTHHCQEVRDEARRVRDELKAYVLIHIQSNRNLFRAYQEARSNIERKRIDLSEQERSYMESKLSAARKEGCYLNDSDFEWMKDLKTRMNVLETAFLKNLDEDRSHFWLEENELQGVPSHVVERLERNGNLYKVTCDYPTYYPIIENCSVESTRRKIYIAFNNRGDEANGTILSELVACRDKLAVLLGYECFAEYDIEDQMAQSPETVSQFIDNIVAVGQKKMDQEMELLLQSLPESVRLTDEGKINPWDIHYLYSQSIARTFSFNESKFNEYFPCSVIINKLLGIYSGLFKLEFNRIPSVDLWDPAAFMLGVTDKQTNRFLGHIILDLFPRDGKYSHCCCVDVLSPVKGVDGIAPAIAVVLANLTPESPGKPSLLNFDDVVTLFHELGHAMHQLLGVAEMPSLSGYHTKADFLELPSILMEEMLSSPNILAQLGEHYFTKAAIPESLIQTKLASKRHGEGHFHLDQMIKARLSLELFLPGTNKDLKSVRESIESRVLPRVAIATESHYERTFRHLADALYRSKYYAYHWAEVFAKDVHKTICESENESDGWLRFRNQILEAGGGVDPTQLLVTFLGRQPSLQAFLDIVDKSLILPTP